MRVRIGANLALVLVSVLVALAALEIAVRIVNAFDDNYLDELVNFRTVARNRDLTLADLIQTVEDDLIVYRLRPNVRGRFLGHELSINSQGLRGPERPLRKRAGAFRIVGLGDSQMFGWGVAQEDTFLALLEGQLNGTSQGSRYEVLNLAVPGYNTVQEVQAFAARIEDLDPDLIIINYVDNDMDLPNFLAQRQDPLSLRTSYLVRLLKRRWVLLGGSPLLPVSLTGVPMDERSLRFRLPKERVPERYHPLYGRENMTRAFDRLAAIARSKGVPAVLLVNMDDYRHRLAGRSSTVLPGTVRRLVEHCAREGYVVVDPQERIMEHLRTNSLRTEDLWVSRNDSHPNEVRHRLVAEELFDRLRQEGLVPIPASPEK